MEQITTELTDGILTITLNRPDRLNAWTATMCRELIEAFDQADADDDVRVLIITGAGRGFCAGADLEAGAETFDYRARGGEGRPRDNGGQFTLRIFQCTKPVIAAVNGPAAGLGFALTLGCDIRFAAPEAIFRAAFINVGVSNCDMGTSWLLPRLIGASRSHEMMLTGRRVGAEEALAIGLVAEVVPGPELLDRSLEAATQIASLAPWGVRLTKQGIWSALEIGSEQAAIEFEDRQQIMATFGAAPPEAVGAFLEKRPAEFAD
jgi:enoyl-CoA hydratase